MLFWFAWYIFALVCAEEYVVFAPGMDSKEFVHHVQAHGDTIVFKDRVGAPGWFLVEAPQDDNHPHLSALRDSSSISVMSKLVELQRNTRTVDPKLVDEWYLTGRSHFGSEVPISVDVERVWDEYDGRGVSICVVDDAVYSKHGDLEAAFDSKRSRSMCGGSSVDPPNSAYRHGTSAAAVAVARRNNGVCGVGVAPGATLGAVRLLSCRMTDANEATALSHKCDAHASERNDIYSSSWGPIDDGRHIEKPGVATQAAMEHCIQHGRDGKGSIYVVAGGNGRTNKDNMGWDGYASSIYTISVGAIANDGIAAYYSEWGSAMLCSVGSSGGSNGRYANIATSSYNTFDKNYCDWFGGTSAACPQVAGLVALLLQKRPDLTWRDVQHIIVHASDPVDLRNTVHPWVTNAAGFTHSNLYGFGQLRAPNMLRVAETWEKVGEWKHFCSTPRDAHHTKIKNGERGEFSLSFQTHVNKVEHVVLHVDIDFDGSVSDLGRIRLTAPSGTTSLVIGENKQSKDHLDWEFVTVRFWGERPSGEWQILMENTGRKSFYLNSVTICVYGS